MAMLRRAGRARSAGAAAADTPALTSLAPGTCAEICSVRLAAPTRLRLAEFGLRPGAVVRMVSRTAGGGCMLALGQSRVAVDERTAACLRVTAGPAARGAVA